MFKKKNVPPDKKAAPDKNPASDKKAASDRKEKALVRSNSSSTYVTGTSNVATKSGKSETSTGKESKASTLQTPPSNTATSNKTSIPSIIIPDPSDQTDEDDAPDYDYYYRNGSLNGSANTSRMTIAGIVYEVDGNSIVGVISDDDTLIDRDEVYDALYSDGKVGVVSSAEVRMHFHEKSHCTVCDTTLDDVVCPHLDSSPTHTKSIKSMKSIKSNSSSKSIKSDASIKSNKSNKK